MKLYKLEYCTLSKNINFEAIKDGELFISNGLLYIKLRKNDLIEYNLMENKINACSINGGLTFFDNDEEVKQIIKDNNY